MKSVILNSMFLVGFSCVVSAAFMVSVPLGLVVFGCPLIAIPIHTQMKATAK